MKVITLLRNSNNCHYEKIAVEFAPRGKHLKFATRLGREIYSIWGKTETFAIRLPEKITGGVLKRSGGKTKKFAKTLRPPPKKKITAFKGILLGTRTK